jgi:hypothetical protein
MQRSASWTLSFTTVNHSNFKKLLILKTLTGCLDCRIRQPEKSKYEKFGRRHRRNLRVDSWSCCWRSYLVHLRQKVSVLHLVLFRNLEGN